ncbi:hypothetical protein IAT40_001762 [Kwoniella sp. CBS 6097]
MPSATATKGSTDLSLFARGRRRADPPVEEQLNPPKGAKPRTGEERWALYRRKLKRMSNVTTKDGLQHLHDQFMHANGEYQAAEEICEAAHKVRISAMDKTAAYEDQRAGRQGETDTVHDLRDDLEKELDAEGFRKPKHSQDGYSLSEYWHSTHAVDWDAEKWNAEIATIRKTTEDVQTRTRRHQRQAEKARERLNKAKKASSAKPSAASADGTSISGGEGKTSLSDEVATSEISRLSSVTPPSGTSLSEPDSNTVTYTDQTATIEQVQPSTAPRDPKRSEDPSVSQSDQNSWYAQLSDAVHRYSVTFSSSPNMPEPAVTSSGHAGSGLCY